MSESERETVTKSVIDSLLVGDFKNAARMDYTSSCEDDKHGMRFNCLLDPKSQRLYAYLQKSQDEEIKLGRGPVLALMTLAEQLHLQKVLLCVDRSTPRLGLFVRNMLDLGFEVVSSADHIKDTDDGFWLLEAELPDEEDDDFGSECVGTQFGEESTIGGFSDSESESDQDLEDCLSDSLSGSSRSTLRLFGIPELCCTDDEDLSDLHLN